MNLSEMRILGWWSIKDNSSNPQLIDATTMNTLINAALKDLASELSIIKSAALSFVGGVASLPSDFFSPEACYHGTAPMKQLNKINQGRVADNADTSQFFIPDNSNINIYGKTPSNTVTLWYKSYPDELTGDSAAPTELPERFHAYIPTVWVPAMNDLRRGQIYNYGKRLELWQEVKKEIAVVCQQYRVGAANIPGKLKV